MFRVFCFRFEVSGWGFGVRSLGVSPPQPLFPLLPILPLFPFWLFDKSCGGLNPDEFEALCLHFDEAWQAYIRYYTLEGKPRARQSKPRTNSTLPTSEDKLLFVLYFLKTNPLQEVLASAFSMRHCRRPPSG